MAQPSGEQDQSSPEVRRKIPGINFYQQKKTLAEGMMDIALVSANANQLRYVLEIGDQEPSMFWTSVVLITISLVLQIVAGILLCLNLRYKIKEQRGMEKANRINDWTLIVIFFITLINCFIPAFGVTNHSTHSKPPPKLSAIVQNVTTTTSEDLLFKI